MEKFLKDDPTIEFYFLSCLLSKPDLINRVASKIKPEYLQEEFCQIIYSKMLELGSYSTPVLIKELNGVIKMQDILENECLVSLVTKEKFDGYAYYVLESYKQREIKKLIDLGNIEDISSKIDEIRQMAYFEKDEINESEAYLENVEQRYQGKVDERNVPTFFTNMDDKIDGFRKTELIIIGGRPGSGKTTFGMNLAYNMAKAKKKVLFCSLEMGKIELHERLVKSKTKIHDYRKMTPEDFDEIIKASKYIKEELPLTLYDKPGMTIENITYMAKQSAYDAIFIDHLSILKSVRKFKTRYEEVTYLSGRLKVLARELDVPVITLCQLNRGVESRDIKAPTMADLRDSGSIEQDADLIGFVFRPEYHLKDKEPDDVDSEEHIKWEEEMQQVKGKAQLILAKNRRGYVGRFRFGFDAENYTFYERELQ